MLFDLMTKSALLIVQKASSNSGRVGERLRGKGYDLDIRCPNEGAKLPDSMEGLDAVVIFGGPMSANDDATLPGVRAQLDFLPTAMESGKPILGICLGAQLVARTLGATVRPHPDGLVEIGYHRIVPTTAGAHHFDRPMMVYHWHREGFDLPRDAICLATGDRFTHQAFRYGDNTYGVQFHPEVVRATIELWTERASQHLDLPGAHPRDAQLADFDRHDPGTDRWLDRFLDRVLDSRKLGGVGD
jgi:GMP synthase (glutamine-hydrolysing)